MRKILSLKTLDIAIVVIALAMSLYHFASAFHLWQTSIEHQDTHLFLAFLLVYLTQMKSSKKRWWPLLLGFLLMGLVSTGYIWWYHDILQETYTIPTTIEIIIGIMLVVAAWEGNRRSFGWALPIVALVFVAYTFLGHYLPYPFWHFPLTLPTIVNQWVMNLNKGIFGPILALSANFLFVFILFGAILQATGASRFFIEVGKWAGRRFAGGAGLTAVVSSALVGMSSGSGMANVAITGPFTIPLMKKVGYSAEQAGAIEATASTGGNIMPPVMGVVAFVMAEFTGVPYIKIIAYAAIPAILYYICVGLYVQFNACKLKIAPMKEPIDFHAMRLGAPLFFVPLTVLVYLLVQGRSLGFSIFFTMSTLIILSLLRKETRGTWKTWVNSLTEGAILGSRLALSLAVVGLIMANINVTGIALKFPAIMETLAGGNLILGLLITGAIIIVLGSSLPPFASYLIVAILIVPVLIKMGVAFLSAHFFVYYFAVFALITPPVGAACIVAAPLSGANYLKLSVEALKAAVVAWILPFLAIFVPLVILQPVEPLLEAIKLITTVILIIILQVFIVGYFLVKTNYKTRTLAGISAIALFGFIVATNYTLLIVGLSLGALLTLWQLRERRSSAFS